MDADIDLSAMPREDLLALIAQLQRRIEALEGKAKPGGPKGMPGIKPKSGRQQTPREKGPRKPRPHGFAASARLPPTGWSTSWTPASSAAPARPVESLEARLSGGGGPGARMPGHKPAARRKEAAEQEKKPRKKRPHGFARTRMEPTRRVVHAPESCPECHTTLTGGWVQRTREVIGIPAAPVEVTEHVFMARTCPLCRKRRLPQEPLQGVAAGRQRLGVNPVSLIITLREEGRLPVRTIQWYLRTAHQLKLSVGAIVRTIHQAAQQAGPAVPDRPSMKSWSVSAVVR